MNNNRNETDISTIKNVMIDASKLGIFIGAICIIIYAISINHFPHQVTVGDGLLFILAGTCFGFIYLLFVISFTSLGVLFSPFLKKVLGLIDDVRMKIKGKNRSPIHEYAPFEWNSIAFSIIALLFINMLGSNTPEAYYKLPIMSALLYQFYSIYRSCTLKLEQIKKQEGNKVFLNENSNSIEKLEKFDLKRTQYTSLIVIMVLPLLLGGVSSQLLSGAMRLAMIRIDNTAIYLASDYVPLLPADLVDRQSKKPKGYVKYKNINVLFRGFGDTTVISFLDGKIITQLAIPNDKILILR